MAKRSAGFSRRMLLLLLIAVLLSATASSAAARTRLLWGRSLAGLAEITEPIVQGVANPFLTGVGHGVAGAAAGTARTADLLGDAFGSLFHVVGGVAANTGQGADVAVASGATSVQDTVAAVQNNHGVIGDVVRVVGG